MFVTSECSTHHRLALHLVLFGEDAIGEVVVLLEVEVQGEAHGGALAKRYRDVLQQLQHRLVCFLLIEKHKSNDNNCQKILHIVQGFSLKIIIRGQESRFGFLIL
jgi:hypothetical protein